MKLTKVRALLKPKKITNIFRYLKDQSIYICLAINSNMYLWHFILVKIMLSRFKKLIKVGTKNGPKSFDINIS